MLQDEVSCLDACIDPPKLAFTFQDALFSEGWDPYFGVDLHKTHGAYLGIAPWIEFRPGLVVNDGEEQVFEFVMCDLIIDSGEYDGVLVGDGFHPGEIELSEGIGILVIWAVCVPVCLLVCVLGYVSRGIDVGMRQGDFPRF